MKRNGQNKRDGKKPRNEVGKGGGAAAAARPPGY